MERYAFDIVERTIIERLAGTARHLQGDLPAKQIRRFLQVFSPTFDIPCYFSRLPDLDFLLFSPENHVLSNGIASCDNRIPGTMPISTAVDKAAEQVRRAPLLSRWTAWSERFSLARVNEIASSPRTQTLHLERVALMMLLQLLPKTQGHMIGQ